MNDSLHFEERFIFINHYSSLAKTQRHVPHTPIMVEQFHFLFSLQSLSPAAPAPFPHVLPAWAGLLQGQTLERLWAVPISHSLAALGCAHFSVPGGALGCAHLCRAGINHPLTRRGGGSAAQRRISFPFQGLN